MTKPPSIEQNQLSFTHFRVYSEEVCAEQASRPEGASSAATAAREVKAGPDETAQQDAWPKPARPGESPEAIGFGAEKSKGTGPGRRWSGGAADSESLNGRQQRPAA